MQKNIKNIAWVYYMLLAMALLIVGIRSRYISEPLENDLTIRFDYVTRHLHGSQYYSDLVAFGPVGSLWINEAFIRLLGSNANTIFLIGCVFSILTLLGVYFLARKWAGQLAGLVAAMIWTTLSFGLATQANQPNTEVYILALVVWGFVALQRPASTASIDAAGVCAGLLFFLATAVKHHMLFMPLMAFFGHALNGWRPSQATGGLILKRWLVAGLVAIACWSALFAYYALSGRFPLFWDGLFGQSLRYAGERGGIIDNLLRSLAPYYLIPAEQRPHLILYVLLAASVLAGFLMRRVSFALLLGGLVFGTWLSITIPNRGYPHYFTLWHGLLAVGTGCAFALIREALPERRRQACTIMSILFSIVFFGSRVIEVWQHNAEQAVYLKYGNILGARFSEARRIGLYIADHEPMSTVGEIGASGLHFWSNHLPPEPFVDSLYAGGVTAELYRSKMIPKLLDNPPDLMVVARDFLSPESKDPRAKVAQKILSSHVYTERTDLSGKALIVLKLKKN